MILTLDWACATGFAWYAPRSPPELKRMHFFELLQWSSSNASEPPREPSRAERVTC